MATGTSTVTLFLERRNNSEWKIIQQAIKSFFGNFKDSKVNNIDKAFSKYVTHAYSNIELTDYITLCKQKPNEAIKLTEMFIDYELWFNDLNEIKLLMEKSTFIEKSEAEKKVELEKLFYTKVFNIEMDKMLYFFLTLNEKTVIIKTNKGLASTKEEKSIETQEEKEFIGYEFSSRRGHEGIKMYRDDKGIPSTKLYDDSNTLNKAKSNFYVHSSFLNSYPEIEEELKDNVNTIDLNTLIDFSQLIFDNSISLSGKQTASEIQKDKVDIKFTELTDTFENVPLQKIITLQNGKGLSKSAMVKGKHLVYGGNGITGSHNSYVSKAATIAIGRVGAYCGTIHLTEPESWITDNSMFVNGFLQKINLKYLFFALRNLNLNQYANQSSHPNISQPTVLSKRIPFPKPEEQKKIASQLEKLLKKV
jgi:type I restriction enzyme M protein